MNECKCNIFSILLDHRIHYIYITKNSIQFEIWTSKEMACHQYLNGDFAGVCRFHQSFNLSTLINDSRYFN